MSHQIGLIVGSLRKESLNLKLANALISISPQALQMNIISIADLPMYNEDLDQNIPASWEEFRKKIQAMDGIIFITPEYNRSIPGALKNAIDVGSRPYGQSSWSKKPCAVISSSPGAIGGFAANHHLRQTFVFLDMPILQQPEVYLSQVDKIFDTEGKIQNEGTKKFLEQFLSTFAKWVEKHSV